MAPGGNRGKGANAMVGQRTVRLGKMTAKDRQFDALLRRATQLQKNRRLLQEER
jgi:hypothetical protein